jgi:hypothetical protein
VRLLVPARSRATTNIRALNLDNPYKSVGLIINSDVPIVPERVEYFGAGSGSAKFGSSVSGGFTGGSSTLYVPYGSYGGRVANGDQDFITVLNPGKQTTPIMVTANFVDASGRALGNPARVSVPAGARRTIAASQVLGALKVGLFSVLLHASGPVEAEAAQYYGGSPNVGAHPGVAVAAQPVGLASGYVSDLSTALEDGTVIGRTLYLFNPGASLVRLNTTFYGGAGHTTSKAYGVPARGIMAVSVGHATQSAFQPGQIGAKVTTTSGTTGAFMAIGIGTSGDGRSVTGDVAVSGS